MGKRDNDMKVMGWEESLFSVLEPFGLAQTLAFGTVAVTARVVGDAGESAILVTDIDVSPQGCRPTPGDIGHGFSLFQGKRVVILIFFSVEMKDIHNLQGGSCTQPGGGFHGVLR